MTFAHQPLTDYEHQLFRRAAAWPDCAWTELTPELVSEISNQHGIDFATALLFDRLRRSICHGSFIREIESHETASTVEFEQPTVAIVPGAFYLEHPESGADGRFVREQAEQLGCRVEIVPLLSFGSVRENARRLCDWLARQPVHQPLVLVSLSKGGAEVRQAMAGTDSGKLFRKVVAWVNLSGIVYGTPIINWLKRHPLRTMLVRGMFWWHKYDWDGVNELQHGGLLGGEFHVPEHIQIVHVFGFPLTQHLSRPLAQRGHRRLSALGPNDGGTNMLVDLVRLPGQIYPLWGADHYLQPNRNLVSRILHWVQKRIVAEQLGECRSSAEEIAFESSAQRRDL